MPVIRFERVRKKWREKDVLFLRFNLPYLRNMVRKSSLESWGKSSHAQAYVLGKVLGNLTMLFYEAIVFISLRFKLYTM